MKLQAPGEARPSCTTRDIANHTLSSTRRGFSASTAHLNGMPSNHISPKFLR